MVQSSTQNVDYLILIRFITMIRLTFLLCLVALAISQNKYTNFTTFDNPSNFSSVVWAQDLSFVMLYG